MYPGGQIISGAGAIGGAGQVQRPYGQLFNVPSEGNFRGDGKGFLDSFTKGFTSYKPKEKDSQEEFYSNLNNQMKQASQATTGRVADNMVLYTPERREPMVIGGKPGSPGYGGQIGSGIGTAIGGPIGGAIGGAIGGIFCDVRVKEDIAPLQNSEVNDVLSECAFFVKNLNECS